MEPKPKRFTKKTSIKYLLWALGLAVALLLPEFVTSTYTMVLLNMALIYTIVVSGFNVILGFAGILSFAQAAFWGIGAYTSALLSVDLGVSFWIAMPAAGFVTAAFGVALGFPTLRLRSHYLAMTTIGFSEIIRLVLQNFERLTHGATGVGNIPAPSIAGFALVGPVKFYYFALAMAGLSILFCLRLRSSRVGRALQAIRDDELSAEAMGVNLTYCKVLAFALSAALAGIGGSLFAHFAAYISPDMFGLDATIKFLSMLLIGGIGSVSGPIVGSVILTFLPEWLRFLEHYYMAIYGAGIVLMLVVIPGGLVGVVSCLYRRIRSVRPSRYASREHPA